MINYLLYSFPKETRLSQKRKYQFYGLVLSLAMIAVSFIAYMFSQMSYTAITLIIGLLIFIGISIWLERDNVKTVNTDYIEYNKDLDKLRDVLKNAKYKIQIRSSNEVELNWYTKDKLKYLIEEFDKLLSSKAKVSVPSVNALKYALIPVVSFAAGVIADKAELSISIAIAFIAGIIILTVWGIVQIVNTLSDIIFFCTSNYQVKRIHSLLSDLYIRDFDESIDIITSEETT